MRVILHRVGLLLAVGVAAAPLLAGRATQPKETTNAYFVGKVVPLAEVRDNLKQAYDATHVLVADNGKIYPLVKDAGARMFAKDKRLLNRPMRLTARLDPKSRMLQVINVHSLKDGKLHEVYYWCDICTIKGFENTICECCGAPMEFREVLVKE
jgi:hypothetical protein